MSNCKAFPTVFSLEAKRIIREIANDMRQGIVPLDVKDFTALHEHVDANEYLIDEGLFDPEAQIDDMNAVISDVDRWLRSLPARDINTIWAHRPII